MEANMKIEPIYEKIKKLVANSEISLLNEQIWQQHKTIMFLEERVIAFERLVASYTKVTMDLSKEVRAGVAVQGLKTNKGKYGRSAEEVAKRWSEWKRQEEEEGMTRAQIARRWGVDRATVEYARAKGYSCRPKTYIPKSLIGHEIVALPPTRKGPRKHKTDLRLAA